MIAGPAELAAFERIEDPEGYRRFFNVFWNRRNPMRGAPTMHTWQSTTADYG